MTHTSKNSGFSFVELSITLIVLGFLIGGVLLGYVFLEGSVTRSVISQKKSFDIAVNAFELKYGALPGDISPNKAAARGIFAFTGGNAGNPGYGDENGLVDGETAGNLCYKEALVFWRHLSEAGLLQGVYGGTQTANLIASDTGMSNSAVPLSADTFFPLAKGGGGLVRTGIINMHVATIFPLYGPDDIRQFYYYTDIGDLTNDGNCNESLVSYSPATLYNMDTKIDDGMPMTGKVINYNIFSFEGIAPNFCTYDPQGLGRFFSVEVKYNPSSDTGGERSCGLAIEFD